MRKRQKLIKKTIRIVHRRCTIMQGCFFYGANCKLCKKPKNRLNYREDKKNKVEFYNKLL